MKESRDIYRLHFSYWLISAIWLYLISGLMITDVWDETDILVKTQLKPFSDFSLYQTLQFIWLEYVLYRPIPLSILAIIDQLYGLHYVHLRYLNALLVIISIYLLLNSLTTIFQVAYRKALLFAVIALFSSASIITVGWFANLFDAFCLFFISLGIFFFSKQQYILCATALGLSFYCKETSILIIPFLGILLVNKRIGLKPTIIIIVIVALYAISYGYLRQRVVPIGSNTDIHEFPMHVFLPSFFTFIESFWWQHTKYSPYSVEAWLGLSVFLLSIIAIKKPINKLFAVSIIVISAIAYWGMIGYQESVIIIHYHFIGRLYLIPSIMILYLITIDAKKPILFLVAILVMLSAYKTYHAHIMFQQLYAEIYELASHNTQTLVVHYPEKPLNDPLRKIFIGNYLNAKIFVDRYHATLIVKE